MIRPAKSTDVPRIIDMIERLAALVNGLNVDRIRTGETLTDLMQCPDGAVLVSPGGFIAGRVAPTFIGADLVAYEMGWFASDGMGAQLLTAFEAWAASRSAVMVAMSCASASVLRRLERCGYAIAETKMVKRL